MLVFEGVKAVTRRFLRRLFTVLSALSLLTCVATVAVWVASLRAPIRYVRVTPQWDEHTVQVDSGRIVWTKMFASRSFRLDDLAAPARLAPRRRATGRSLLRRFDSVAMR